MFVRQDQVKQYLKRRYLIKRKSFNGNQTNHIVNHDVIQVNYENLNNQL
jgi:hypothetical protein